MFHALRQAATTQPLVMIRLLEVLAEVGAVEGDPARRAELRRHAALACDAALPAAGGDASVRAAVTERHAAAVRALDGEGGGAGAAEPRRRRS